MALSELQSGEAAAERLRVLVCALSFGEGLDGAALSATLVARLLDEACEVAVLTGANHSDRPGVFELRLARQRAALPMLVRLPTRMLGLRRQVERVLDRTRPDIIHLQDQDLADPLIPAARARGIPVLVTLRDDRFARDVGHSRLRSRNGSPPEMIAATRAFLNMMEWKRPVTWTLPLLVPLLHAMPSRVRTLLGQATALLPVSDYIAAQVRRCGIKTPCRVLRLIPTHDWVPAPLRASSHPAFLAAGRLVRGKGLYTLLRSFARVRQEISGARLLIAGKGPQHRFLDGVARRMGCNGSVEFLGHVSQRDMPDLLAGVDIVVLPSHLGEGLPRVVLEAMTAGRPVIASRTGGVSDLLDDSSGVLVTPGDEAELAAAMLRLARSPGLQHRLARAARRRVAPFRPAALRRELLSIYGELVGESRAATRRAVARECAPAD
jgi:glycosyltransferase involved in cell wall biosynthesis